MLKTAVVTGATGAIGKAIARKLVAGGEHEVVIIARDDGRGRAAVDEIRRATGSEHIHHELADLGRRATIEALRSRLPARIDVLINNAAVAPRRREETPEGIERQLATNVLGYLWLTLALRDHLAAAAPSRVVNVASYWAGGLDVTDLGFERRPYDNGAAYRQSKQADRMLTVALAERLHGDGIHVNACHSGDVRSTLSNSLGFGGHETPDDGAQTPVWLATDSIGEQSSGKYFEHLRETPCRFGGDREGVEALFAALAAVAS